MTPGATSGLPSELALIDVDGVEIAVERRGSGPIVLCLHAVGHDRRDFSQLADRLGARCQFVLLDWPGHGGSGSDRQPVGAARCADLAAAVLRALAIQQPVILGNSIGGAAAILIAAGQPVRGLVLCDPGGLVEITPHVVRFCKAFERFFAAGERGAWWYPWVFARYYSQVLRTAVARGRRAEIVAGARAHARVLREAWSSFSKPDADLRDRAAALTCPILVAWARRDRVIPLSRCRPAIARLQHGQLEVFEGGHSPFLEEPDRFAKAFEVFVTSMPVEGART